MQLLTIEVGWPLLPDCCVEVTQPAHEDSRRVDTRGQHFILQIWLPGSVEYQKTVTYNLPQVVLSETNERNPHWIH